LYKKTCEFHVSGHNVEVRKGERSLVCWPSGSGKSRMIAFINRLEEHQKVARSSSTAALTSDVNQIDAIRRCEVGNWYSRVQPFSDKTVLEKTLRWSLIWFPDARE